ncbi:MAG TPA: MarR family transcriptional regulator [Thermoplasmata archaeon]|nr:MarR family transcriptional regulator [Thermoplasmata archaeon]
MTIALRDALEPTFKRMGITGGEIALIHLLTKQGPATFGKLAGMFGVKPPRITEMVNHLEEKGLVSRQRTKEDRRLVYVTPTSKGRRMGERIGGLCAREISRATLQMGPRSKRALASGLSELAAGLARRAPGASAGGKH